MLEDTYGLHRTARLKNTIESLSSITDNDDPKIVLLTALITIQQLEPPYQRYHKRSQHEQSVHHSFRKQSPQEQCNKSISTTEQRTQASTGLASAHSSIVHSLLPLSTFRWTAWTDIKDLRLTQPDIQPSVRSEHIDRAPETCWNEARRFLQGGLQE
jgi:hypothetical protein